MELSRWENLAHRSGLAVIAAIFQFPDESSGDETHRLGHWVSNGFGGLAPGCWNDVTGKDHDVRNGIFNLTNWTGNVIMPTLSGLFFAIALIRAVGPGQHQKWMWAGFLSLTVSGMLRGLETFSSQAAWDNPDLYWMALMAWSIGLQCGDADVWRTPDCGGILHYAGIGHRVYGGGDWMRHFAIAAGCFMLSESCG